MARRPPGSGVILIAMPSTTSPLTTDIPLRPYRHLRRLLAALLLALVAVAALRICVGTATARQMAALMDQRRALGLATSVDDLAGDAVPDEDNAAVVWGQAINAMNPAAESPAESISVFRSYPPYGQNWFDLARGSRAGNPGIFPLAHKAATLDRANWKIDYNARLTFNSGLAGLNDLRGLANKLGDDLLLRHFDGDDAAAVAQASDLLHYGSTIRETPIMVWNLVGVGIEALALHRIEVMAGDLNGSTVPAARPADSKAVRELIRLLLDDAGLIRQAQRAAASDPLTLGKLMAGFDSTLMTRALADRDRYREIRRATVMAGVEDYAELLRVTDLAMFNSGMTPDDFSYLGVAPGAKSWPRFSRVTPDIGGRSWEKYFLVTLRIRTERQVAATALAARLFYLDHGRWPNYISELVPGYLPRPPVNYTSVTQKPIEYLVTTTRDGALRPMLVFAFGDSPASGDPPPAYPQYGQNSNTYMQKNTRRAVRQWRDLSRWDPNHNFDWFGGELDSPFGGE